MVLTKGFQERRLNGAKWNVVGAAVFKGEFAGQIFDVPGTLTEREQAEVEDIEPVIKIRAEAAGADELFQVVVGGDDQPGLGELSCIAADRLVLARFNDAEELGLLVGGSTSISSSRSVPLPAAANFPSRSLSAPVNAPLT